MEILRGYETRVYFRLFVVVSLLKVFFLPLFIFRFFFCNRFIYYCCLTKSRMAQQIMGLTLISLPDDLLLVSFLYLEKRSLKKLAKVCKTFFRLLTPIIRELISQSRRGREARNALVTTRCILRYVWNPLEDVELDGNLHYHPLPLNEYDYYLARIFISGAITPLTIDQYAVLLHEAETFGWNNYVGEESKRRKAAQKQNDLRLSAINLKDPEVLNQLGLKALDLCKRDAGLFDFALCCFIELTLCFPSFTRGKKNLLSVIKFEPYLSRNFECNISFFHTAEEVRAEAAKYTSLLSEVEVSY